MYRKVKKQVRSILRKMKVVWCLTKAAGLQKAVDEKYSKAFYDGPKKVYCSIEKEAPTVLSSNSQTLLTYEKDILVR